MNNKQESASTLPFFSSGLATWICLLLRVDAMPEEGSTRNISLEYLSWDFIIISASS